MTGEPRVGMASCGLCGRFGVVPVDTANCLMRCAECCPAELAAVLAPPVTDSCGSRWFIWDGEPDVPLRCVCGCGAVAFVPAGALLSWHWHAASLFGDGARAAVVLVSAECRAAVWDGAACLALWGGWAVLRDGLSVRRSFVWFG